VAGAQSVGSASTDGVVVAYNGTARGRAALDVACDLAAAREARLTVLVVARRVPRYGETVAEVQEADTRRGQAVRRLRSETLARCTERGVQPAVTVTGNRSARALRAELSRHPYSIVVVTAQPLTSLLARVAILRQRRGHVITVS
jgi:nucleotide-binding universal stress UspA family protein